MDRYELLVSLLQFFAMEADGQLEYAKGIPLASEDQNFPFGLDHSPLIEMVNGVYNIARVFAARPGISPRAVRALEEFEELLELIRTQRSGEMLNWTAESLRSSTKWRLARKLGQSCLQELGIPLSQPAISYGDLMPLVMD
jgi:hypothetical protein